jgi:hypothetical protein
MRLNAFEFGLEQGYVGEAIVICLFLEAILLADEFKRQPRRSRFVKMGRHLVHRHLCHLCHGKKKIPNFRRTGVRHTYSYLCYVLSTREKFLGKHFNDQIMDFVDAWRPASFGGDGALTDDVQLGSILDKILEE